jgi:hypothetical protein
MEGLKDRDQKGAASAQSAEASESSPRAAMARPAEPAATKGSAQNLEQEPNGN